MVGQYFTVRIVRVQSVSFMLSNRDYRKSSDALSAFAFRYNGTVKARRDNNKIYESNGHYRIF